MYRAIKKEPPAVRQWLRSLPVKTRRFAFRCYRDWWVNTGIPFDFRALAVDMGMGDSIDDPIEDVEETAVACPNEPEPEADPQPDPIKDVEKAAVACPDEPETTACVWV